MLTVRMHPGLARRVDPSDIVQEALVEAWKQLPEYLEAQPLPFYPWLRQIAWRRLLDLHRVHLQAQKRDVRRERDLHVPLPDRSSTELSDLMSRSLTTASQRLVRSELRQRVRAAIDRLQELHRDVLVLRYLEGLSTAEAAAVLGVAEGTIKSRLVRALEQLRTLLEDESLEGR
jgi:RNA polymerase sigma-70 factor (ECF subfamily)